MSTTANKPIKMRGARSLPPTSEWPHGPVLVCANIPGSGKIKVQKHGNGPCPIGVPFRFESDLFVGTALIRIKNLKSDNPVGDAAYFDGRARIFQSIVQGRFKEEISVSEVLTGHEFVRPLKRIPPSFILSPATSIIRRIAPGSEINLNQKQPSAMSLLAATSQCVRVDVPGEEPLITDIDIEEDCALLGGHFANGNVKSEGRKKVLKNLDKAAEYKYDTKSVYTFDFYQSLLDVNTYCLDMGFVKFSLVRHLDGQPIQVLSKTADGRYLWSFQIWHEKLITPKQRGSLLRRRSSKSLLRKLSSKKVLSVE